MSLVESLLKGDWLRTTRIIEAFQKIKRVDFVPEDMKDLAEINEALPIGLGQTISQPLVVAFMLEQLQPEPGNKILDIGSGSGWTTALLSEIVGEKGKVFAIEIVPELKEFGEKNVSKYNFIEKGIAKFILTDGSKGYPNITSCPELAEGFDRILTSASAKEIPQAWREQLKIGGKIVAPINSSIWVLIKRSPSSAKAMEGKKKEFEEIEYPGFAFVPLISEQSVNNEQ